MRFTRWRTGAILALCCTPAAWATGGDGLKAGGEDLPWARWQGRISLAIAAPTWRSTLAGNEMPGLRVNAVSIASDYYFTEPLIGSATRGGFRATSGLILGPRSPAVAGQPGWAAGGIANITLERRLSVGTGLGAMGEPAPETASLPYLGVGYTGLSQRGRWSFNADLGWVALSPGNAVKFGRVVNGAQSLDDMLRDMRLAPVLQMGVSYAF